VSIPCFKIGYSDFLLYTAICLFGLSNGFATSMTFLYTPIEFSLHQKELATTILSLFLALGLTIGANFGLLFLLLPQGKKVS